MATKNSLTQKKPSFSTFMTGDAIKKRIGSMMGQAAGERFCTAVTSAVTVNPALQECEHMSIFSAALLGESLGLSPSPQLGHYYMVPFRDKNRGNVAQFILGYKGYIQLAIRSGYYKKINVIAIKEGELVSYNPLDEEIKVQIIEDEDAREKATTVGYYAMFEYSNGFKKTLYWSKKKMETHALQYSAGYKGDKSRGTKYTFWSKDFDGMAFKTMLRQLISKWGIMSIELETAIDKDAGVVKEDLSIDYVDTVDPAEETPQEPQEPAKDDEDSQGAEQVEAEVVTEGQDSFFEQ